MKGQAFLLMMLGVLGAILFFFVWDTLDRKERELLEDKHVKPEKLRAMMREKLENIVKHPTLCACNFSRDRKIIVPAQGGAVSLNDGLYTDPKHGCQSAKADLNLWDKVGPKATLKRLNIRAAAPPGGALDIPASIEYRITFFQKHFVSGHRLPDKEMILDDHVDIRLSGYRSVDGFHINGCVY